MGLWDRLKGELIDIIQWLDAAPNTMVHRFERHGNEIKYGAKLVVREGQAAVFVNEGQLADVFQPGTYTLETKNLPVLSTILGWYYGFESPFKAEVYFISMKQFTDLKWGTMNPLMTRDAEFGPVRLRAFGTYAMRVQKPDAFIRQIVGTNAHFNTDGITDQLRNVIVSRFTDILGESKIPVLDLAANYEELGTFLTQKIGPEFESYGLELTKVLVENISLPPEVEQALDQRSKIGVIGNLAQYTQIQTADAMRDAAKNPGGMAAGGMGMGMGYAMANQIGQSMSQAANAPGMGAAPPPLPTQKMYHVAINNQPAGPFDLATVVRKVQAGEVRRDTLVWTAGMADWADAGKVTDLASAFDSVPPPLAARPK